MNPPPYLWTFILAASVTIVFLVLVGIAAALRTAGQPSPQVRRRVWGAGLLLFAWLAVAAALGALGLFRARTDQVGLAIGLAIVLPIIVGALLIRGSAVVRDILRAVPQSWLVGVQAYRGLGSIFLVLLGVGLLPGEFALPAGFGDVFIGIAAIPAAVYYAVGAPGRGSLVVLWNVLGIADLVVAVGSGFLSTPSPLQLLALANPNQLVGAYPLVLIPVFAVPLSIVLHIASLTKLAWAKKATLAAAARS
jgi:hypothetical protein